VQSGRLNQHALLRIDLVPSRLIIAQRIVNAGLRRPTATHRRPSPRAARCTRFDANARSVTLCPIRPAQQNARSRSGRPTRRGLRPSATTKPASRSSHNRASSGRTNRRAGQPRRRSPPSGPPEGLVRIVQRGRQSLPGRMSRISSYMLIYRDDGRRGKASRTRARFHQSGTSCCQLTTSSPPGYQGRNPKRASFPVESTTGHNISKSSSNRALLKSKPRRARARAGTSRRRPKPDRESSARLASMEAAPGRRREETFIDN
jgi:hypothetical protein